jgi:hypothetical protein
MHALEVGCDRSTEAGHLGLDSQEPLSERRDIGAVGPVEEGAVALAASAWHGAAVGSTRGVV